MKSDLTIDTDQLEAFAAGAKERKGGHMPWDKHDPKALPKHNVSVRLNDYHLEMLRYLAEDMDVSQQKILRKHIVPVIEQLAEQAYMAGPLRRVGADSDMGEAEDAARARSAYPLRLPPRRLRSARHGQGEA